MGRPRIPLISRESAVQTALLVIAADGYDNFSVEKVARAMGVKSPSLYHHFVNRSGLLTEVARGLFERLPLDPDPEVEEWREWFVSLSMGTYDVIMRNPHAAGLLFTHFPASVVVPAHERGAYVLASAGIPAADRWVVMRGLEKLVFGLAAADANDLVNDRKQLPNGMERTSVPYLVEAVEAGERNPRDLVESAVRLYLDGVEARRDAASMSLPHSATR